MNHIALLAASFVLIAAVSNPAAGQEPTSMQMNKMDVKAKDKASPGVHSGTGLVKSVDSVGGAITLAHEPIKSLNWPAMTMGFKVKDKGLLDKVKPGDKVQFSLVQSGKDYVVTSIK